jgi:hypothetical protein
LDEVLVLARQSTMRVTQRIYSPTEVSEAERRVVQSVFFYFHTTVLEGREKLFE